MSRVCVKNLPKYVAEDYLRDFFSEKGEVTDAKLMRTRDGKSRQFAFIGFRTEEQAQEALKYFNNSYMDTCRITCEMARKVGDPDIPRPWSRHSATKQEALNEDKKKTGTAKSSKGESKKQKENDEINDPGLKDFLEVMKPRAKAKLWANDTVGNTVVGQNGKSGGEETRLDKGDKKQSVPLKVKVDEHGERKNESSDAHSAKQSNDLARNEVLSDLDYFKSRVKKEWSDSDSDSGSDSGPESDDDGSNSESLDGKVVDAEESHDQSSQGKAEEEGPSEGSDGEMMGSDDPSSALGDEKKQVLETGRLFVRNLPYTATEEDLMEVFSKFGDVVEVHLVVDKDTKRSKGFAYILFALPESAVRALEELDNSIFQGRLLHILPAKQQNASKKQESNVTGQASKTFKQQVDPKKSIRS